MSPARPRPLPDADERLLLVAEVAAILRVSPREVARYIGRRAREHPLPAVRLGRLVRVRRATLDAWIREEEGTG